MNAATFVRSWPSAAAWGAGLIMAALGAGAIVGSDSGAAARGLGVGLVGLGLASLVWGAATLSAGRLTVPRIALTGALVSLVATAAVLFAMPARVSVLAVSAGISLIVVVGASAAVHLRRARRDGAASPAGKPMSVIGLLVAAAVVAVVVTPALNATQGALLLRDDGTVPVISHNH
ncbi:MAG: hypothetical protein FJW64_14225 [Actinobacteria bacterium]|nr:hypothetical protein [Actinomycetota bacterium]